MSTASSWMRWLSSPWCTLPMELSGPGDRPARSLARTRWFVQPRTCSSHQSRTTWSRCTGLPQPPGRPSAAEPLGQPHQRVGPAAADPVDAARARARDHLALARERGVGHLPALAHLADPLGVGHAGVVEEDLVEVDLAADVAQRPHVDAGLAQVDQEVGDALALGHVGVGPGQQHGVGREVRPRRPHLLAVDDPLVPVALGPGGQRRQVRARARLAEELAPPLLVAHDAAGDSGAAAPRCRGRRAPARPG